ncbi:MAG: hypothetical protein EBU88_18365 [Acidobacteria bacterium]|nr:hypothetical protein [Acidobacteriota bacterium]
MQCIGEGGALEFVRSPPATAVPFAELVAHLGIRNHRREQALGSDEIRQVFDRQDGRGAAEIAALRGAIRIKDADGLAALTADRFFLLFQGFLWF